jgi:hypothetical protein
MAEKVEKSDITVVLQQSMDTSERIIFWSGGVHKN